MTSQKFTRLIRFLTAGPSPRIVYGNAILPPGTSDPRLATHAHLIAGPSPLHSPAISTLTSTTLPIGKLLCPIPQEEIRTVRCLGLNYVKHAQESNLPLPEYPVLFYKPRTAVAGPEEDIAVPKHAQDLPGLDYEVELVVIIGKSGRDIPPERVKDHIFGFTVGNDVSHRELQLKRGGGQWSSGKGCASWAPIGPAVVPELEREGKEMMWCYVNGERRQWDEVGGFCFGVEEAVSYLSRGTVLEVGDLLFMGTPSGVGMGKKPPVWLKEGDVVQCGIEGIGSIENKVVFEKDAAYKL